MRLCYIYYFVTYIFHLNRSASLPGHINIPTSVFRVAAQYFIVRICCNLSISFPVLTVKAVSDCSIFINNTAVNIFVHALHPCPTLCLVLSGFSFFESLPKNVIAGPKGLTCLRLWIHTVHSFRSASQSVTPPAVCENASFPHSWPINK